MDLTSDVPVIEGNEGASIAEDLIPRAHATDLIRKEKEAAYRKAQREFQTQLDGLKTGQQQQTGGMQAAPDELIDQAVERKLSALREQYEASQEQERKAEYQAFVSEQAKSYLEKMDKSGGLADDFKEMTSRFKPDKFREIFFLANSYENTPHIIYELGKNPEKLAMINMMMKDDPEVAKAMLDSLSKSIDVNEQAKENNKSAPPPLGQPKPSLAAGQDSGPMSLAELKRSSFLRG
jgi:hypothetical protein